MDNAALMVGVADWSCQYLTVHWGLSLDPRLTGYTDAEWLFVITRVLQSDFVGLCWLAGVLPTSAMHMRENDVTCW